MAYSLPALINGKSNEWADIVINALGSTFTGVTAIEYSLAQEMENVYGAGNKPVSRSYGNFMPDGKITILMEELEALQAAAPFGVLQRIPEFDITVFYFDPSLPPRTHTLKNVRIKNNVSSHSMRMTRLKLQRITLKSQTNKLDVLFQN
jgi:hypothetical protein